MKVNAILILFGLGLFACSKKEESISPTTGSITESIYASGTVKSADQYQAFVSISGIIEEIYVQEGQEVEVGTPLLRVSNETQKFNLENAQLTANFNDLANNQGKLSEAEALAQTAKAKLKLDSSLFARQKTLWSQQVGTRVEFEQKELNYQSAKANYLSATQRYKELKRQIN
jgi:multidrug efflux pump subunit AcrA (membrane-fusion protein)